jgi:heme-degrading monooxygenase HmoA
MTDKVTVAMIRAKPGVRDEIIRIWRTKAQDYIETQSGFRNVFYCSDDSDPDGIIIIMFGDEAAAADFKSQAWFSDFQQTTHDLIAGPGDIRTASPAYVKGMSLAG